MKFDDYQQKAAETAVYPVEHRRTYPLISLAGEVGELLNKYKKLLRGDPQSTFFEMQLVGELGGVLWYLAQVCTDFGISLDDVASENLKTLASRKERGTLKGSGDDR